MAESRDSDARALVLTLLRGHRGGRRGRRAGEPSTDAELVAALRAGDEAVFESLVMRHHDAMLRVARLHVRDRAAAEEVVQDTWVAVIRGLDRFEERASLRTWIFRILQNQAITRGQREHRTVPFSALGGDNGDGGDGGDGPTVDPDRFHPASDRDHPGAWSAPPARWSALPEDRLLAAETLAHVRAAIATLPPAQQVVIGLRDVDGWSGPDVSEILGITLINQRVLLHRARAAVRRALETYLTETG